MASAEWAFPPCWALWPAAPSRSSPSTRWRRSANWPWLGAAAAVAPEEAADAIATLTGGAGADVVIETAGKAVVLAAAYKATRRGGRTVTVGLPNPAEMLSIPAVSLVGDGKTLMGSYMGSAIPARDVPRYIALWRAGRLPVERLLTSVSPLSDINRLMDELAAGRAIRQIVVPNA